MGRVSASGLRKTKSARRTAYLRRHPEPSREPALSDVERGSPLRGSVRLSLAPTPRPNEGFLHLGRNDDLRSAINGEAAGAGFTGWGGQGSAMNGGATARFEGPVTLDRRELLRRILRRAQSEADIDQLLFIYG